MVTRYKINEIGIDGCDSAEEDPGGEWVLYTDHEAALKAKDEEIRALRVDLKAAQVGIVPAHCMLMRKEEYYDLLDQAIRFADLYLRKLETTHGMNAHKIPAYHEATDFLTRPEVQARRKKDLPIQCDWDGTGFY